jgi:hypothetical protein
MQVAAAATACILALDFSNVAPALVEAGLLPALNTPPPHRHAALLLLTP